MTPGPESSASTLEGQIVRLADIIAYVSHDLDDAIRGGVISADDVPREISLVVGLKHSRRIDRMVRDLIAESLRQEGVVRISSEMDEAIRALRSWLFEHVYQIDRVHEDFIKASHLLRELFLYFMDNEKVFVKLGGHRFEGDTLEVSVADFIAGMTDRFALTLYKRLFLPQSWKAI